MTRTNRIAVAAALAVAAGACRKADPPPAPPVETVRALAAIVASCASAVGTVEVRRAGQGAWEAVVPGSVFRVGDEVRTGALSGARLEFVAGGGLELEESAGVRVDTAPPGPAVPGDVAAETRVAVQEGVVRGFLPESVSSTSTRRAALVVAVGDGRDLRLAAGAGGGATFRLSRKEGGTEVAVTGGEATLAGPGGARALAAGQVVLASLGGVSEPAQLIQFPLSVEPGIDARLHLVPGVTVRLAWKAVAGAVAYRVQVARDLSFQHLDRSARVEATELVLTPREPGMYTWRVASIDGERRQGEYGFARRLYCEEKPPVDLLVGPADAAVLRFADTPPEVTFTWAPSGAAAYRVVLASGPDLLEQRVQSAVVAGQRARLGVPEAGEYWWGVYEEPQAPDRPLQPLFAKARRISVVKAARPRVDVQRSITRWGE